MLVFDVGVHVGALLRAVATVRTLEPGALATLVLEVPPQSVPLLVNLAASFTEVTRRWLLRRFLRKLLLLLRLLARLLQIGGRLRKNNEWKTE